MQNTLFLIIFAGCAIYGLWSVMRRTRQIRAPRQYKDVLLGWSEPPGSGLRDDPATWAAIALHRGTAIVLGLAALLILVTRPAAALSPPGLPMFEWFLLGPLLLGIVGVIGYLWGFVTGGIVADATAGDRHYAISEAGVLAAGRLLPWEALSHMSIDHERSSVRIFSASLPGTVAFSFHPPAEEWGSLLGALQSHLPLRDETTRWTERFGFPLRMAALCTPFLAAAVILYWMPAPGALVALCVLQWLLLALGSSFIMRSVFGGKSRGAVQGKV